MGEEAIQFFKIVLAKGKTSSRVICHCDGTQFFTKQRRKLKTNPRRIILRHQLCHKLCRLRHVGQLLRRNIACNRFRRWQFIGRKLLRLDENKSVTDATVWVEKKKCRRQRNRNRDGSATIFSLEGFVSLEVKWRYACTSFLPSHFHLHSTFLCPLVLCESSCSGVMQIPVVWLESLPRTLWIVSNGLLSSLVLWLYLIRTHSRWNWLNGIPLVTDIHVWHPTRECYTGNYQNFCAIS